MSVGCVVTKLVVILLSESVVFICHPLKCSLVFPKDLSFRYTYLFITDLCNSIKHPQYLLFADNQNCSFHKLCNWQYPSTIWHWFHSRSVCCWLHTGKTKVSSTLLTRYCLNQSKWNSYVLWLTVCLLLTVPYCYIIPQLVLSKNMPHLPAVTLWLLMPIGRNTTNSSLQLNASVAFFHHSLYNYIYAH